LLTGHATPYLHNGVVYVGDEDHYVSVWRYSEKNLKKPLAIYITRILDWSIYIYVFMFYVFKHKQ
jgi:hypothetical protein